MEALGRLFDIGTGWAPVDLDTADGATGKRISMMGARGITFVVFTAAGGATAATFNVLQHTAYTGGTSKHLDSDPSTGSIDSTGVDHYYIKSETLLDNDETWIRVAQTAASEVTLGTTFGDDQYILVIEVDARQLGAGFSHVSLDATATLGAPKLGACLYFMHELRYQRKPASLPNLLRPGVANA